MNDSYKDVAGLMATQKKCVVLSGAGISAESGIPTFRSKGGLWEKYDPTVYASIEVFNKDPSKYWKIRGDFIKNYDRYQPNAAHRALRELEKMGIVRQVITQLEKAYPGIEARLCEEGRLRSNISVMVDGHVSTQRLRHKLTETSEVHFLPAISGGRA